MSDLPTVQWLLEHKPHLTPVVMLQESDGETRVVYALQPKQIEAYNLTPLARKPEVSGPVHIGFGGAAGPGKSYCARVIATSVALTWPGSSCVIYRKTKADVKKNHVKDFMDEVPRHLGLWTSYNGDDLCVTWANKSKTYFGYLRYDEDVQRAQGVAFDCIIFEEATHYTWYMISWLVGNRLRSSVDGTVPFAFYPSNPGERGMCLPPDTDVLTHEGWRPIAAIGLGEEVATLDEDESLVFRPVDQVHCEHYRGPFVTINSATATIRCTPNHHIARRTETKRPSGRTWHPISLVRADALSKVTRTIRSAKRWTGVPLGEVRLEPIATTRRRPSQPLHITGDDYAALAGWMVSEGWTVLRPQSLGRRGHRAVFGIAQTTAPGRATIKALLTKIGFRFREIRQGFEVSSLEWCHHWRDQVGVECCSKRMPPALRAASRSQLQQFWQAAMAGDGSHGVYYTASPRLADDMMEVGLKLGFAPRLRSRLRLEPGGVVREQRLRGAVARGPLGRAYEVRFRDGRDGWLERQYVAHVAYDGPVYCLGIADLHRFFVRQDGMVWLSGNSWYKRLFIQRRYRGNERSEDYAFVQAKLSDNVELLTRNPDYIRKLDILPEPARSWLRDGNFSAGAGSALPQIDWKRHLVKPFKDEIPDYWLQFGSFDWGYHHPFVFGWYVVTEDGDIFKVETVTGWRMLTPQQIERIKSIVPVEKLHYIVAGHDVTGKHIARGEDVPTIQEHFLEHNILLSLANIHRKQGLQQLRKMLDWETSGPFVGGKPTEGDPRLRFFDTPNNRKCLEQMENMTVDPRDPEDVLKVNADDFGEGGDDMYDETRYACASRPPSPDSPWAQSELDAWSPAVLEHEMREGRRVKRHTDKGKGVLPDAVY